MGDIAVDSFLETLKQLITNSKLLLIIGEKHQLQSLEMEIKYLREFLKVTEKKRNEHIEVMNLVMQIRDVVFESENTVELFVAHAYSLSHWDKFFEWLSLCKLFHWAPFCELFCCKLLSKDQDHPSLDLESVQKEIKTLIAKVKQIYDENMYDINGLAVKKLKHSFTGSSGGGSSSSGGRNTSKVVKDKVLVGFKDEFEILMGKLHDSGEGGRLEIISIVGAGGSGKTTLARELYDHPLILHKFEICAWVNVSQDYYMTMKRDLLISILESAFSKNHEDYEERSEDMLGEMVYKCLKGKKYLIVMDDIWSIEAWNDIQRSFPRGTNGSKVLLTSRLLVQPDNVLCIPHFLDPLSKSCSWELLQKKVLGEKQCPPELVEIGKEIAEKCKGLPLAIVFIASILEKEDKTLDVWENIAKQIGVEKVVVGFEDELRKLREELHYSREGGELEIISIIGPPGGGKTTLAREAYQDPRTSRVFDILAWVVVSQDYDKTAKRDMLLSILKSASKEKYEDYAKSNEEILGEKVLKCLKGKKYLIVMDDIWSIEAWNDIQKSFPKKCKGSKVLLTSRQLLVQLDSDCCIHRLAPLQESYSWELLEKKVFGMTRCPRKLVDIGKQIAVKCKGLPLAIVTIAGILANEDKTVDVWKKVVKRLSSIIAKKQEGCMEILELSYNHLPLHLKACYLYIGAHPEDEEIPIRELIWLWIAEGFIQQSEVGKSLEAVAKEYLISLIDRGLVMVARKSKSHEEIKACRIHDLLRELCLKKAEEDNFLVPIYSDDSFSPSTTNKYHRLFIGSQFFHKFSSRPCARKLRSFLCLSSPNASSFSENLSYFVENFEFLRVLNFISATSLGEIGIGDLVHLRYLALGLPKELLCSPNSFHYLSNLETLNLHVPLLGKISLPRDIVKMVRLRHLYSKCGRFEYHHVLSCCEDKGNVLDSLQTLHRMCICKHCLRLLKRTPNLRKLGLEGDNVLMLPNLEFLKCLETLNVQSTRVASTGLKLPLTLTRLTLMRTYLKWEELSIIVQTLLGLEVLKLFMDACSGSVWNTSELEKGFSKLKYLRLQEVDIEEWSASKDEFLQLEVLVIQQCTKLKGIPIDFANLYELREIKVQGSSRSVEESARKIQKGQIYIKGDDDCLNLLITRENDD